MSLVQFVSSGILQVSKIKDTNQSISGYGLIYNPETYSLENYINVTNDSGIYNIEDAHTSLDQYQVAVVSPGYYSESRQYKGMSSTLPLLVENFQEEVTIKPSSTGTTIVDRDFEDATTSGFNIAVSGSGITVSGLVNLTNMQGDYYIGLAASATSMLVAEPTAPEASNLTCGRTIFLMRLPTSTSSANSAVGFAFLRQSSDVASSGYKVFFEATTNSRISVSFMAGPITSTSDMTAGGNSIFFEQIDYSSNTERDEDRLRWVVIEWEAGSIGTFINLYSKVYTVGDTIASVKSSAILIVQLLYTGFTSGDAFYTTTSFPVAYLLGSQNTSLGSVGFDMVYLEQLSSLYQGGLNKLELKYTNSSVSSNERRPLFINGLSGDGDPPEGIILYNHLNYLISPEESPYNKAGYAYHGIRTIASSTPTTGQHGYGFFEFRGAEASGITHGVARFALTLGNHALTTFCKVGLAILRQGSAVDSNAYVVEWAIINTSSLINCKIRKGQIFSSTLDNVADFQGSILATSSNITDRDLWVEIRWKAEALRTDIEVLYSPINIRLDGFDTSPGNVDYKLADSVSYTDVSSPYTTTSLAPLIIPRCGLTETNIYQIELRKSKW